MEWCGGSFDPGAFDLQTLNRAVHSGWAPAEDRRLTFITDRDGE
jgi:hypothetical protein